MIGAIISILIIVILIILLIIVLRRRSKMNNKNIEDLGNKTTLLQETNKNPHKEQTESIDSD